MPSLLSMYISAPKVKNAMLKTKGDILTELMAALKMPYPTVRRKIFEQSFSYAERLVICLHYKKDMKDLFPNEHELQNQITNH
jgi:hypothetical protein